MNDSLSKPPAKRDSRGAPQAPTPVIDVRELLAGRREAIIVHGGERYRLRVTANDKLIFTK